MTSVVEWRNRLARALRDPRKLLAAASRLSESVQDRVRGARYGVNSVAYWNSRFKANWEERNGRLQTAIFAGAFVTLDLRLEARSILDYGCGLGDALPFLRMKYPDSKLYYYDFAAEAMRKVQQSYGYLAAPLEQAPEARFDLVFCSNVIEHVIDLEGFCRRLVSLSRRYVIILTPFNERHPDGAPLSPGRTIAEHVRTITATSLDGVGGVVWQTRLLEAPGAWVGKQILFVGEVQADEA